MMPSERPKLRQPDRLAWTAAFLKGYRAPAEHGLNEESDCRRYPLAKGRHAGKRRGDDGADLI
jgi:hypothetical protein